MKNFIKQILAAVVMCFSTLTYADDIDILNVSSDANILFIMDLSGA